MLQYLLRRLVNMVITLLAISILTFAIIQLPPGDYVSTQIAQLQRMDVDVNQELIDSLTRQYGLDKPLFVQYFLWITKFVQGDMGRSFVWNRPVNELVWERIGLTFVISLSSLAFSWIIAIPVGIYAAVRQYSPGDYADTFASFIGLAVPNFMLALALMYVGSRHLGLDVGGLFSIEYQEAPWSPGKVVDLLKHLWIPTIVLGTSGTAALVRVMRNNLLDELRKLYVIAARSKGLSEPRLIIRYPVRI